MMQNKKGSGTHRKEDFKFYFETRGRVFSKYIGDTDLFGYKKNPSSDEHISKATFFLEVIETKKRNLWLARALV